MKTPRRPQRARIGAHHSANAQAAISAVPRAMTENSARSRMSAGRPEQFRPQIAQRNPGQIFQLNSAVCREPLAAHPIRDRARRDVERLRQRNHAAGSFDRLG